MGGGVRGVGGDLDCPEKIGGDGRPMVAAFSAEPLAAAMGIATTSALALMADALEVAHRLPRVMVRVEALEVPVWRARSIAQATSGLSPEAGAHVDAEIAARAHREAEEAVQESWDVSLTHAGQRDGRWLGTSWVQITGDTPEPGRRYATSALIRGWLTGSRVTVTPALDHIDPDDSPARPLPTPSHSCNSELHESYTPPMSTRAHQTDGRRSAAAARRRAREAEILAATRALFDERGVRDAQIEDIARAVGINRAIVYRHFTGKEELFALTLVGYLDELRVDLEQASTAASAPRERLADIVGAFVDYSLAHPAFVDCAQALMRRSGPELLDEISESALFRLGRAISGALSVLSGALEDGVEAGDFTVTDPTLLANTLYASGLGALQLARVGILVKEAAPGVPTVGEISAAQVREYLVASALALATLR